MVLAHPDFPEPESAIEVMLMKTGWFAYQCTFERHPGRCGKWYDPMDCVWQEDQGRCAMPSHYLLPRLLAFLHCRDDAVITPFWDRCYVTGLLRDSDECGQSDGNWFRCWWFPARTEEEVDVCAPSPAGGVENRDAYDELVAQMRAGVWQREWFGECPTAELVYTIRSACNYTSRADCAADPSCAPHPDPSTPPEYGACGLRDELVWDAIFGAGSALFNATAAAMSECAAASSSLESCMAAGSLAGPDGRVPLDAERFGGDLPDLVFIEELQGGAAAGRPRARLLAVVAAAAAMLLVLLAL